MYEEGRKKRDDRNKGNNPCEISLTDTDFCVYIRPEFIIRPWLFMVSFFGIPCFYLNFRVSFCVVNYFVGISFYLPRRNAICYSLLVCLNPVSV